MSKGSKRRPASVSKQKWEENWVRTFGEKSKASGSRTERWTGSTAERLKAYVEELKASPLTTPHTENGDTT